MGIAIEVLGFRLVVMLQGSHVRRSEAWTSTLHAVETRNEIIARRLSSRRTGICRMRNFDRLCKCSGAVTMVCSSLDTSLKIPCNQLRPSLGFRNRVLGEIGPRKLHSRHWNVSIVMAGRQDAENTRTGTMNNETSEGLREELLVPSIVDESPQIMRGVPMNLAAGVGVTAAVIMMTVLGFVAKPRNDDGGGSVSDLIKRGQLRSDRGDGKSLKYEDPFNNPFVGGKGGKENSVVKMYGRLFRVAPTTLTDEKRLSHQNRRVQAYRWKRPVVFFE